MTTYREWTVMIDTRLCGALAVIWGWLFVGLLANCPADETRSAPQRVVSMAPSTTEVLFALGLGDRVVGVTRYCDYPAAAREIDRVGGYVDPNYEQIVALQPDLVVLLDSHREAKAELEKLRIPTLTTQHATIGDVHEAIRLIGNACHAKRQSTKLLDDLTRRTRAIQRAVEDKQRPKVLICIGRDTTSERLSAMYIAGRKGFYDEIIELAGGTNAYQDERVAHPQVSAEGVLGLNPDFIVDLVSDIPSGGKKPAEVEQPWRTLGPVAAVRNGQVHVIVGNHALRPGPRYVEFLEQLARLLHPDCFAAEGDDG